MPSPVQDCVKNEGFASIMIAILFWFMCLSACVYALLLGGWEGRWTTLIIVLGLARHAPRE